jgi:uncharacterized membrane protein
MKVKRIVTASLFAALCCVMTLAVQFPAPMEGYIHLGDSLVLLSGFLLSPVYAMTAAGIGSALADLLSGYGHYAPATLIIKALMALLASVLNRMVFRTSAKRVPSLAIGAITAEIFMILSYFAYGTLIMGEAAALSSIPLNALQGVFGAVSSVSLAMLLTANKSIERILQ